MLTAHELEVNKICFLMVQSIVSIIPMVSFLKLLRKEPFVGQFFGGESKNLIIQIEMKWLEILEVSIFL